MYLSDSIHGLPGANLGFEGLSPCKIVGLSVSPSFSQHIVSQQSVSQSMERVCAAIIFILFSPPFSSSTAAAAAAIAAFAAAVCWLDLPRDLSPPSFPASFAVTPTKERSLNFPPEIQIPEVLLSRNRPLLGLRIGQETAEDGANAERTAAAAAKRGKEGAGEEEATRSNIRNRRLPHSVSLSFYMTGL